MGHTWSVFVVCGLVGALPGVLPSGWGSRGRGAPPMVAAMWPVRSGSTLLQRSRCCSRFTVGIEDPTSPLLFPLPAYSVIGVAGVPP